MQTSFLLRMTLAVLALGQSAALHSSDAFLVRDGRASAEIVNAENPLRSARLAAQE